MMKNYQLALSVVADSSAAAFAFTMPKTPSEWIQLVLLILSVISLILGFIIKGLSIAQNAKAKKLTNSQAAVMMAEEAQKKIEEATKILSQYSKKGKFRVEVK